MNKKWIAIVTLLVLMLSVCVFAAAEEPTDPVYPVPGPLEKHEHTVSIKIVDRGYTAHRLQEWCPDCGRLLKERLEKHNFVDGVCTVCDWECPHPSEAAEKHYERDGVKPQWDGNYIIGPGWEITECGVCHTELSRVETTVREFHNIHTHFTPVLECLPHNADTHALIRYCDECGTEVPEYVPHNCPPSDRPYTDEGDPDTHSRLVRCADCGFWVPQQQAHTWVHDSYTEFDGSEDYHNEVLRCSVCGAVKQVPRPHELMHVSCRNDGDTATHIEVLVCAQCGAEAERREAHNPMHISWEDISNKQHQETVRCNMCGLTYILEPVAHTFYDYHAGQYFASNGPDSHRVYCWKCGICGAIDYSTYSNAAHGIDTGHVSCYKCDYTKEGHTHEINYNSPDNCVPLNAEQHITHYNCKGYISCWVLLSGDPEPHTFDPVTLKCTVCGYLKEGCEHQYTYKPGRNGITEEQHTLIGTCTGCGKQITVTGAHDMQFVSATDYVSNGDLQHTCTVTERCSACGYEKQYRKTENHIFSSDDSAHECSACGDKREHDYFVVKCTLNDDELYCHTCLYQCRICEHQIEKIEEHEWETEYLINDSRTHMEYDWCPLCHYGRKENCPHEFGENWTCIFCGYHEGEPIRDTPLPQENLTEDYGDETMVIPVSCCLTADGNEILYSYALVQPEGGDVTDLRLLPESIFGDSVIGVRFTASEIGLLQSLGVKDVYIRLNKKDILLLDDISRASAVLTEQERDELVITLTPGSDGACTVQYDPAGVYITE